MTTFLSDIILAGANDIQFKNTSGANTGKIESDGNDLVLSNAVGDILLGDGSSDVYIGDGTNSVDILFEVSGAISAESGAALTIGGEGGTLSLTSPTITGTITDSTSSLAFLAGAQTFTGQKFFDAGFDAHPIMLSGSQNFDNIDRSGFYNLYGTSSGSTNSPTGITYGTMIAIGNDKTSQGFGFQLAHQRTGGAGQLQVRGMNDSGNAWTSWNTVYTASDTAAVANSASTIATGDQIHDFVIGLGYLPKAGGTMSGAIAMGSQNITGAGTITGTTLTGTSLDINGAADISGNLTGVDTLTATTLSVTNYGLATADIPNNGADTTGNAATATLATDATNLNATDDRDMAPEDYGYTNDFRVFFTSKEGLEDGTSTGSNWQDVIYLNSYADASGGDANILAFDKSEKKIYHYQADQAATNWGTAKQLAYTDSDITGNADTATLAADATTLATPRAINGVNFDGSAAITVTAAAGTLSGTELADGVVTSALTSVGTIGTGTWQGTRVASLYLDADTAHLTTDQTFTGVKTFDETIVGSVNGSAATVTSGSQANITTLAGVTSIGTAGATTNVLAGDLTMYNPVNGGNPTISIGSSATERLEIQAGYESGAQGLDIVRFTTFTAGSGSNDGRYAFEVDDVFLLNILDDGIRIKSSGKLEIGSGNAILSDSSGTTTLSNIDALDATTVATIKAAVKNVMHYDFQGYATGDGTNYEMANNLSDTNAPFEHNISLGADGTTATTIQNIIRSGGKVMPRACTLTRWTGWAAAAGSATAYVALFKVTPTRNSNTDLSAVLLDEFSYTALGNAKMEDFDETSFTATAIAAGDILITAMKSQSGGIHYFTSTVEVEF